MAKRRQTTGTPSRERQQSAQVNQQRQQEQLQQTPLQRAFESLIGNPQTREEREEALSKLITRSIGGVIGIFAVVILVAVLFNEFIVPSQTVASVEDENVSVAEFRDRVRFERVLLNNQVQQVVNLANQAGIDPNQLFQQQQYSALLNELNFPDQLGRRVIDDMIDDAIVRLEARERDIEVADNTVQNQVYEYFDYDPTEAALIGVDPTETPTPTITPTPFVSPTPTVTPPPTNTPTPLPEAEATAEVTPEAEPIATSTLPPSPTPDATDVFEDFEDQRENFYGFVRDNAQIGNTAIDSFFEREALRRAVRDAVAGDVETQTVVDARHILVETEEEAQEILDALENGEAFADLARALSTDTGSGSRGGELGEAPSSNYVPPFAEAVESAEIGEIVGPVQSEFGFHIIQVRSRSEEPVEGDQLEQVREAAFREWLEEQRETLDDQINIADNWPDYVPQT